MNGGCSKTQRVVTCKGTGDIGTQDGGVQNGGSTIKNNLVVAEVASDVRAGDAGSGDLRNQISALAAIDGAAEHIALEVDAVITTVGLNQRGTQ